MALFENASQVAQTGSPPSLVKHIVMGDSCVHNPRTAIPVAPQEQAITAVQSRILSLASTHNALIFESTEFAFPTNVHRVSEIAVRITEWAATGAIIAE
jgi:hypothetical protein